MKQTDEADNPYTRGMASFVANLRYEDIPEDVRARIKLLLLDSLGCGIYGSLPRHSRILIRTLGKLDSSGACCVWGTRNRLSAPHAALANGSMTQGFELDSMHSRAIMHIGSETVPALVAVAELRPGISGRKFLAAAVAGYEVGPRVGLCMGQGHLAQGWHCGTKGVFSAAASAASALGLSEEQTVHALGIAGTQAAGLMAAQFGSMVKRMHAGRAAQSGLYGALLAEEGYTGIRSVFESDYGGYCTTFSRSKDRFDMDELTKGLGREFETMRDSLKFYSCAASNHATLDAIRMIMERRPFKAEDVEKITAHGSYLVVEHVGWKYRPAGLTAAQMNLPFCVATLLLEGDVFVDQFSEDVVHNPARIALAERVEVVEDPAVTAKGAGSRYEVRVEVRLKDGTTLSQHVEAARGSDRKFATEAEVLEKFRKLVSKVLPPRQVEQIGETVLKLEQLADASSLAKMLALQ